MYGTLPVQTSAIVAERSGAIRSWTSRTGALVGPDWVRLSFVAGMLRPMSNAAPWAATAGNKFREVTRSTENPATKALAEGLTALSEALRELDAKLEKMERQMRSSIG